MTATTTPRRIFERDDLLTPVPVAAKTLIPEGAIVCLNATGYAVNGAASTDLVYFGCADASVDNSNGADGDLTLLVRRRKAFRWDNDGSVTQAYVGKPAYIADNQTLSATDGSDAKATPAVAAKYSEAGTIIMVDADGVWIY
jgi:hypothetical protein